MPCLHMMFPPSLLTCMVMGVGQVIRLSDSVASRVGTREASLLGGQISLRHGQASQLYTPLSPGSAAVGEPEIAPQLSSSVCVDHATPCSQGPTAACCSRLRFAPPKHTGGLYYRLSICGRTSSGGVDRCLSDSILPGALQGERPGKKSDWCSHRRLLRGPAAPHRTNLEFARYYIRWRPLRTYLSSSSMLARSLGTSN
ncbi:hypothetical protein BC834DRAFT_874816 [Gloeopeniophorella convolvens]|nr:hypothetical protein BC834DRAFT_874816 [Gloeopeniophorella convolvens]